MGVEGFMDRGLALQKLNQIDERLVQVVELRYFAELGVEETAEILSISSRTVKREWAKARRLLYQELK
jgi:RNA polymerase sigma factor (sigma-70 family)